MSQTFASKDSKSKPKSKSTSKSKSSSSEDISEEDLSFILDLFKYRNISWRYLLCHCLPLQQKILVKQLRIVHDRKSSLSQQRRNSISQEKKSKSSKNIFASFFEDKEDSKNEPDDEDDDIPDFYHLPRISIQELHQMFRDGRQKYEFLKKIYITEKQQVSFPSMTYIHIKAENRNQSLII